MTANMAQWFSFLIDSLVRHFNGSRHNNIMTFRAREQGFSLISVESKKVHKSCQPFSFVFWKLPKLVSLLSLNFYWNNARKNVIHTFKLYFFCNRVEMSRVHRMLGLRESSSIIKSSTSILLTGKAGEYLSKPHIARSTAGLKTACDSKGH